MFYVYAVFKKGNTLLSFTNAQFTELASFTCQRNFGPGHALRKIVTILSARFLSPGDQSHKEMYDNVKVPTQLCSPRETCSA